MKKFAGIYVRNAQAFRVIFEAEDRDAADRIGVDWGIGVEGEAPEANAAAEVPPPEAFSIAEAGRLLGGIKRSTIYRWLGCGKLERLPDCRRVLITRRSILRCAG